MRKWLVFVWLWLLVAPAPAAESWDVFVNNRPFKGRAEGGPAALLLEAAPLAKQVEIGLRIEGDKVLLGDKEVPCQKQGEVLFLKARELCSLAEGGRFVVNQDLKTIDVYLIPRDKGPAGGGPGNITYLMVDSKGYVGGNMAWKLFDNCVFELRGRKDVDVEVRTPDGHSWRLSFGSPDDRPLRPGVYLNAQRMADRGFPDLDFSCDSSGFNTVYGSFTVHDIAFGPKGPIRLAIDFECHEREDPSKKILSGKVRYKTNVP